ncbi:hypothetical protein Fmac_018152 [Flemingia macrophylla]|uniref:Alpha-glucan water dikinase-like N-terminal Ig-like domain-containing protein n=1 Tax=Flemingia macrophylla TaxID=520843 RepID=A0ABD1M4B7_9FABA
MSQMLNASEQRPHTGESSRIEMQKNTENLKQTSFASPPPPTHPTPPRRSSLRRRAVPRLDAAPCLASTSHRSSPRRRDAPHLAALPPRLASLPRRCTSPPRLAASPHLAFLLPPPPPPCLAATSPHPPTAVSFFPSPSPQRPLLSPPPAAPSPLLPPPRPLSLVLSYQFSNKFQPRKECVVKCVVNSLLLHWGVVRDQPGKWVLPSRQPDGTKVYKNGALRTPFTKRRSWKNLFSYMGPGFLVSIAYIDPGNFETDLQSGAQYKYELLWTILMASCATLVIQSMASNLGVENTWQSIEELNIPGCPTSSFGLLLK